MATYNLTAAGINAGSFGSDDIVNCTDNSTSTPIVLPSGGTVGHPVTYNLTSTVMNGVGANATGIDGNGKEYVTINTGEITAYRKGAIDLRGAGLRGHVVSGTTAHHNTLKQSGDAAINCAGNVAAQVTNVTVHDESPIGGAIRMQTTTGGSLVSGFSVYNNEGDAVNFAAADSITIERFNVHTYKDYWDGTYPQQHSDGLSADSCTNATVRWGRIYDFTQLIYIALSDVNGNVCQNFNVYGVEFRQDTYGDGTQFNGGPGIFIPGDGGTGHDISNVQIFWCTFGYCGLPAIRIYKGTNTASNIKIFNNIYNRSRGSGTGNAAVDLDDVAAATTSNYNCAYQCAPWGSEGANSIITNPLVVNDPGWGGSGYNLNLQSGSPCRDTGHPTLAAAVTVPNPSVDYNGHTRSRTGTTTMGAYEYAAAGSAPAHYFRDSLLRGGVWT